MVISTFLSPEKQPYMLLTLLAVMSAVMGTQYISVFGLMTKHLTAEERVAGTTTLALCYSAAGIVVGTLVLYFLADFGWQASATGATVLAILVFSVLAFLTLDAGHGPQKSAARYFDHCKVFRSVGARKLLLLTSLINVSGAAIHGLQPLILIDAGFAVSEASIVTVLGAGSAGLAGAGLSAPLTKRLGGLRSIAIFALFLAATTGGLGALHLSGDAPNTFLVIALILLGSFATLGIMPASKAVLMGYCSTGRETTDFSSYSGVEAVLLMVLIGTMTALSDSFGFWALFLLSTPFAVLGALIALRQALPSSEPQKEAL